VQEHQKPTQHG